MSYKKIDPRLIDLDELVMSCGLFTSDTELNNGYGCKSRSKHKSERGRCFSFDCPLANEADLSDLKKHDETLYEEYREYFKEALSNGASEEDLLPAQSGSYWMIQYYEKT